MKLSGLLVILCAVLGAVLVMDDLAEDSRLDRAWLAALLYVPFGVWLFVHWPRIRR